MTHHFLTVQIFFQGRPAFVNVWARLSIDDPSIGQWFALPTLRPQDRLRAAERAAGLLGPVPKPVEDRQAATGSREGQSRSRSARWGHRDGGLEAFLQIEISPRAIERPWWTFLGAA